MPEEYTEKLVEHRKLMLDNGFSPIPNKDKACFLEGWPKVKIDDAALRKWARMHNAAATGVRVENNLCVIDVDVDHPVADDVASAMLDVIPSHLNPHTLERYGKGHKFAWFCRSDDLFARLHTRRWVAPGSSEDDTTHCVEIFGGGSPRQFGADGVHSFDAEGKIAVVYDWRDQTPWNTPLHELDILGKDELFAMLDAAEQKMEQMGFTPVARTQSGESSAGRVYDLTDDMIFNLDDGRSVSLTELSGMVSDGYTGRCSASWLEGPAAVNRQRCLITKSGSGHVVIWESAEGVSHLAKDLKPLDFAAQVDRIAEKLQERQDLRRSRIVDGDDHISGAAKLLLSYAYAPKLKAGVIPLWPRSSVDGTPLASFRTEMLPYCGEEIGPRGGVKKINPVDVWLSNPQRIVAQGYQMRPDQPRPTFEIDGEVWVNSYRPPQLASSEGGNPDGGIALVEQLLPDLRERGWFRQWLAFKWRYPHIPGSAVIMVSRDFGTGRGTFGAMLKLLFGNQYVVNVPFPIFAGLNTQSQYTEWGIDALFAIVNESSATGDLSSYRVKHDVYEHLKEVIDPRPTERTFIRKGQPPLKSVSSATCMIMTNNPDAIPLPEHDRRFTVVKGGGKRDDDFWQFINDWMEKPENIAAFAEWLEETSLDGYNPFNPLPTILKSEMAEMNKTVFDEILEEALQAMDGYFVKEQVIRHMSEIEIARKLELPKSWKNIAGPQIQIKSFSVRYENGRRISPMIKGRRYPVFHMDEKEALTPADTGAKFFRQELLKNGDVFQSPGAKITTKLKLVGGENTGD